METHLEFAAAGARKHFGRYRHEFGFDYEDYLSAAQAGLVTAAKKFDPSRGFTFKTYAFNWCEQSLRRLHQEHRRANGWAWGSNKAEIAAGAKRNNMIRLVQHVEWPTNEEGEPLELQSCEDAHDERIARTEIRAHILASAQNARERTILEGLLSGKSYEAIGHDIGASRGLVWMLRPAILERARKHLEALGITGASL